MKIKKRFTVIGAVCAVLLAAVIFSLSSCAKSDPLMKYGDCVISENEFKYYLATYKGKFKTSLSGFETGDNYYSVKIGDGRTIEEYLFDTITDNVKMTLVCEGIFDEYGLKLTSAAKKEVSDYVNDFIKEYSGGSKSKFNAELAEYGINADILEDIYLRDTKKTLLYDYLYGDNGETPVTDEERTEYLNENYVRVQHLFVKGYEFEVDEDGYAVYNEDGNINRVPLSGDALAAKNEIISSIDTELAAGGDFDELYDAFSEDKYYENGYYLTRNIDFIREVVDAAFSLECGEWTKVESEYGTSYIKRLEMDERPWMNGSNGDFFEDFENKVREDLFKKMISEKISEVEVDEEAISKYTVEESSVNNRF